MRGAAAIRSSAHPAQPGVAHRVRWCALFALVVLMGACGEAHVVRREPGNDVPARALPMPRHVGAGEIKVIHGDTLYGIAFRNGMDFRELAAINGIEAPYTIHVGQVLKLRGDRARASMPTKPTVQAPPRAMHVVASPATTPAAGQLRGSSEPVVSTSNTPSDKLRAQKQSVPSPFEPVPSVPQTTAALPPIREPSTAANPAQSVPAQAAAPALVSTQPASAQPSSAQRTVPAPVVAQTPSVANVPAAAAPAGGIGWHWPARGTVLDRFMGGDATRQGIDIGGNAGDPVFAASDGVVVYSGSGLVGYGELIIIKHSDEWLSAYGHNRKRLVQEGQRVRAGQPIAEMGRTGAPRDMLHFEIRRNGRPVDPLQYLPGR